MPPTDRQIFVPDTSCMVALVSGWHENNALALDEIGRRLDAGDPMVLAGHALAEVYSVLTRLPQPHRLSGDVAWQLIEVNLLALAHSIESLNGDAYVEVLRECASRGVTGGQVYDALVAAVAERMGAHRLLTFNRRHFRALLRDDIEVVVPTPSEPKRS